jgi:hypothetical protein
MKTWGSMEATPPFSVISLRRLGGAPDLRVPCAFGQRLNGYHPFGGHIVVFYLHRPVALLAHKLQGPGLSPPEKNKHVGGGLSRAALPRWGHDDTPKHLKCKENKREKKRRKRCSLQL